MIPDNFNDLTEDEQIAILRPLLPADYSDKDVAFAAAIERGELRDDLGRDVVRPVGS